MIATATIPASIIAQVVASGTSATCGGGVSVRTGSLVRVRSASKLPGIATVKLAVAKASTSAASGVSRPPPIAAWAGGHATTIDAASIVAHTLAAHTHGERSTARGKQ